MAYYSKFFFVVITMIITVFMVINPQETVKAASNGFQIWYIIILPALFPFFIVAELLVSLRFVHFLGVILEPIMRPLFRLPGCSSLVVTMGFTSGFPVGALLTKKLYEEKMLTAEEAERLVSFTNNSSPLFILGAVSIGMFGISSVGYLLAASHYLSNIMVGIVWRFKAVKQQSLRSTSSKLLIQEALSTLSYADNKDTISIGKALSDAIKNSINNILAIAGFIVVFSVITRMLTVWGILDKLAIFITKLINVSYNVAYGICIGFFEITLGAKTVVSAPSDLLTQLIIVSIILAFSGLSIITQIMSILYGTPIRLSFYLTSRILQMFFSALITFVGYHMFFLTSHPVPTVTIPTYKILYGFDAWTFSIYCLVIGFTLILLLLFISLLKNR
ncbi:Sporulation integral membrane protein YlbJ [Candidatus Syntrophocurvum alkaliphilum]|uniref:Sporulation integral membrane protein YlbJ n=1 Tax=Candidatus Syntrophocurvum alkaliphilum TaxID=2293317 RepID=A0A6I6DHJ3_9FIRM|nr:sporulation integral membrane protein YlbJ [Candidatus Syntrophocurvum alkaliphilum]QGT99079.1 Sporulation integral membrane protein YlbJ [Candidatus Syntrophocurvum alkaliphilum]